MKVLFPFVGDSIGGSHRSAALLISELPKCGVEPVCFVHRGGPLFDFLRGNGLQPAPISGLPYVELSGGVPAYLLRLVHASFKAWLVLQQCRPDIVHVNDARMMITWAFVARASGIPLVVHQRTRLAQSRITKLALSQAAAIVSISDFVAGTLPSTLRERSTVISNPFASPKRFSRSQAREPIVRELSLDPHLPIIACIGTLQAQKRPVIAVAAIAELRRIGLPVNLLLIGRAGGPHTVKVAEAVDQAGLQSNVKILGYRGDAENILQACDVLLAPAVDEGHGRTLVEAMLADVPVVAADSGGHREIISHGRTGILVQPDQPEAFAAALADLIRNPQTAALIAKCARHEAEGAFGAAQHAERVAALYRTIAARQ